MLNPPVARLRPWIFGIMAVLALPAQTPFSIKGHSGFPEPEKQLQELVQTRGRARKNHFEVIGYRTEDGNEQAWIHWIEGKALVLWEPVTDPTFQMALATSRRYLRLPRDVVVTEAQVNGSTYLVTRAWVESVIKDAKTHGDVYVIARKPRRQK